MPRGPYQPNVRLVVSGKYAGRKGNVVSVPWIGNFFNLRLTFNVPEYYTSDDLTARIWINVWRWNTVVVQNHLNHFQEWLRAVDSCLAKQLGITIKDIDIDYHELNVMGKTHEQAAAIAVAHFFERH